MNKDSTTTRGDDLKMIILLFIYYVFTIVIILITDVSPEAWLLTLLLQAGNAISGAPLMVAS